MDESAKWKAVLDEFLYEMDEDWAKEVVRDVLCESEEQAEDLFYKLRRGFTERVKRTCIGLPGNPFCGALKRSDIDDYCHSCENEMIENDKSQANI